MASPQHASAANLLPQPRPCTLFLPAVASNDATAAHKHPCKGIELSNQSVGAARLNQSSCQQVLAHKYGACIHENLSCKVIAQQRRAIHPCIHNLWPGQPDQSACPCHPAQSGCLDHSRSYLQVAVSGEAAVWPAGLCTTGAVPTAMLHRIVLADAPAGDPKQTLSSPDPQPPG